MTNTDCECRLNVMKRNNTRIFINYYFSINDKRSLKSILTQHLYKAICYIRRSATAIARISKISFILLYDLDCNIYIFLDIHKQIPENSVIIPRAFHLDSNRNIYCQICPIGTFLTINPTLRCRLCGDDISRQPAARRDAHL